MKNEPDTLLSLNYVIDTLLDPHVGHKLLIVDACRDEPKQTAVVGGKGIQGSDKISLPSKTAVFFSCSAKEQSYETAKLGTGSGTFTYCLLDGLRGGAADSAGQLTWLQLVSHVENKMESPEVRRLAPRQQPVQAGNAGRVVLGKVALIPSKKSPASPKSQSKPEPPVPTRQTVDDFVGKQAGEGQELVPGMQFRWCPPTSEPFTMGTPGATDVEAPVQVTLSQGFWLGETEVTQGQWESLMKTAPWKGKVNVKEGADYPASYISHGDAGDGKLEADNAGEFCRRLTEQERNEGRLPAGWKFTLPTEAQWEYACRARTKTQYSFGDDESRLGEYAWSGKNGDSNKEKYAHRVRQKKMNPWGLHDMHGNVWEWCADWFQAKLPGGRDPVVLSEG